MGQHTEQIKAFYEPERRPRRGTIGGQVIPAGWTLCFVESGRYVEGDKVRYATREEAEARIPAILAAREARQQQTTQPTPAAPAPRTARPVQDCHYCGLPLTRGECAECGVVPLALLSGFGQRLTH